jgi:hypothetical protein
MNTFISVIQSFVKIIIPFWLCQIIYSHSDLTNLLLLLLDILIIIHFTILITVIPIKNIGLNMDRQIGLLDQPLRTSTPNEQTIRYSFSILKNTKTSLLETWDSQSHKLDIL